MVNEEIVHLAIAPITCPDDNLVGKVSSIINKSPYDTRLLLTGEFPKIIAHDNSIERAEGIIKKLRDLGFVSILLRDSELRQPMTSFKVRTMEFREKGVLFRDRVGHVQVLDENSVSLILEGRIHSAQDIETIRTRKKISLAGTLLTGGIPVSRKVEEKTITQSSQIEYFIRIYKKDLVDNCIDILQHDIDYSFLGVRRAPTAAINFRTTVEKLRETFPQAIFDNRMIKPMVINEYSTNIWEDIEMNCQLLYMFHITGTQHNSLA